MNRKQLLQQLIENFQSVYRGMQHMKSLQRDDIPYGQKAALFSITLYQSINVKQLANMLHVTSGAATQHVESLVQEGLVERTTDPDDRRNVIIVLSAKGKTLMKKLEQQRLMMLEELFSDVTDQELAAYNRVMEQVNNKLK